MTVGDVAEERPEDRPRGARELVHQTGLLRDLQKAQPQRHHADEADRERHGGAGSFERAYVTLTPGAFIGSGKDTADQLAAKIDTISNRKGDIVPDSAMDQGRIEITNAQATAG